MRGSQKRYHQHRRIGTELHWAPGPSGTYPLPPPPYFGQAVGSPSVRRWPRPTTTRCVPLHPHVCRLDKPRCGVTLTRVPAFQRHRGKRPLHPPHRFPDLRTKVAESLVSDPSPPAPRRVIVQATVIRHTQQRAGRRPQRDPHKSTRECRISWARGAGGGSPRGRKGRPVHTRGTSATTDVSGRETTAGGGGCMHRAPRAQTRARTHTYARTPTHPHTHTPTRLQTNR